MRDQGARHDGREATGNDGSISIEANKFDSLFTRQARAAAARAAPARRAARSETLERHRDDARARACAPPRPPRAAPPPPPILSLLSSRSRTHGNKDAKMFERTDVGQTYNVPPEKGFYQNAVSSELTTHWSHVLRGKKH